MALPVARRASLRQAQAGGEPARGDGTGSPESLSDHWATWGAARDGARVVATRAQVGALVLIVGASAMLVAARPRLGLILCLELVAALYFATGLHKIWMLLRAESGDGDSGPIAPRR